MCETSRQDKLASLLFAHLNTLRYTELTEYNGTKHPVEENEYGHPLLPQM